MASPATRRSMRFRPLPASIRRLRPIYTCRIPRRINSRSFSPFYAVSIRLLDLENAARLLTVFFTVWLLGAAWSVARAIDGHDAAWLGAAFLLIVAGDYGGSGVFRILEQYLTARLPAEAMIVTALACHFHGRRRLGYLLAAAALIVHPLIALPGMLLLICMSSSLRLIVLAALAGLIATLGIVVLAIAPPAGTHGMAVMDAAWAEVVRERSQFLFLRLWSVGDWEVNTRPFLYLGFTAIAVPDRRIRALCAAAGLVGAAGLGVAWIGSVTGPVAILVQGQAWRWVWISVFVSVLLLPGVALKVWRDDACGPLCVVLLVSGWTLPIDVGVACVSGSRWPLWVMRSHFQWQVRGIFPLGSSRPRSRDRGFGCRRNLGRLRCRASGRTPLGAAQIRGHLRLAGPGVVTRRTLVWWSVRISRTVGVPMLTAALLGALGRRYSYGRRRSRNHTRSHRPEISVSSPGLEQCHSAEPSTVLVSPPRDVGAFVWFTLQRPELFGKVRSICRRRRFPREPRRWRYTASLGGTAPAHGSELEDSDPFACRRERGTQSRIRDTGTHCNDSAPSMRRPAAWIRNFAQRMSSFHPIRHDRAGAWKGLEPL